MALFGNLFKKSTAASMNDPREDAYWAMVRNAQESYAAGNFEQAAVLCVDILKSWPDDRDTQENLFAVYMQLKQPGKALETLEQAYHGRPQDVVYFVNRSWIALEQHEYDTSIKTATTALGIDSRSSMALNNRGFAFFCLGYFDDSIADLNHALGISPKQDVSRINLISALIQVGDDARAMYEATRLTERGADRDAAYASLAMVHSNFRRPVQALWAIQQRYAAKKSVDAALSAISICSEHGLSVECADWVAKLDALKPSPAAAATKDLLLADATGDLVAARDLWKKVIGTEYQSMLTGYRAADVAREGQLAEALALLDAAASTTGYAWSRLTLRATILTELGRDDELIRELDSWIQRCSKFRQAVSHRAYAACRMGDFERARSLATAMSSSVEDKISTRYLRYTIEYHAGAMTQALDALASGSDHRSPAEDSLYRAAVHTRQESWETAHVELETALQVGRRGFQGNSRSSMGDHWEWMAGCHAHLAVLPGANRHRELTEAMKYYNLAIDAGEFAHRAAWFQPRFYPLREVEGFRRICHSATFD